MNKKRIFVFLGGVFVIFQVFSTIQTATTGEKLAHLEEEIYSLSETKKENEVKLIDASSLSSINEKAVELGFVKIDNSYYAKSGGVYVGALR